MEKRVLSIDIVGTFIKYGYISERGIIESTDKDLSPNNLSNFLNCISAIIEENKTKVIGIAVSCPGKIDCQKGIVYNGGSLPFLHKLKLKSVVEKN